MFETTTQIIYMVSYTIHIINTPFSIPFSNLLRLHVPHATHQPNGSLQSLCWWSLPPRDCNKSHEQLLTHHNYSSTLRHVIKNWHLSLVVPVRPTPLQHVLSPRRNAQAWAPAWHLQCFQIGHGELTRLRNHIFRSCSSRFHTFPHLKTAEYMGSQSTIR